MRLHIILLVIFPSILLSACGEKEIPVVRNSPQKEIVSQNITPPVLENSENITITEISTGSTSIGDVQYETINGIEVPPEPDSVLNNATLEGIDVNGNGVRDDVERKIAIKSADLSEFNNAIKIAQSYQKYLAGGIQTNEESNILLLIISCSSELTKETLQSNDIQKMIINNELRINSYRKSISNFGGIAVDPDSDCK